MGKNFAKSDYGVNKADKDAIVCSSAVGNSIRITRDDFDSDVEFTRWKTRSNADYRQTELTERPYTDNLMFLADLSDEVAKSPSAEETLLSILSAQERNASHKQVQDALTVLTSTEKRRILLHTVKGLTYRQIGHLDGCSHKQVAKSVHSAKEKMKRILKSGVPKP